MTGSGFDLIQTAVMKVQGKNLTVFEVRAQYLPFHFLFLFIFCHLLSSSVTSESHHSSCARLKIRSFREFPLCLLPLLTVASVADRPPQMSRDHDRSGDSFTHTYNISAPCFLRSARFPYASSALSHFLGCITLKLEGLRIAAPLFLRLPKHNCVLRPAQSSRTGSARELEGLTHSLTAFALQCIGEC